MSIASVSASLEQSSEMIMTTISGNGWTIAQVYECAVGNNSAHPLLVGSAESSVGSASLNCTLLQQEVQYTAISSASRLFSHFLEVAQSQASSTFQIARQKVQEIGSTTAARLSNFSTALFSRSFELPSTVVTAGQKVKEMGNATRAALWSFPTAALPQTQEICGMPSTELSTNPSTALTVSQKVQEAFPAINEGAWNFSTTATNIGHALVEVAPNAGMLAGEYVVGGLCTMIEQKRQCQIPTHMRVALKIATVGGIAYVTGTSIVPYATGRAIALVLPKVIKGTFRAFSK